MTVPSRSQFDFLQSIDTPTVCNLVEIVAPERRGFGYTVKHLHCPFPELAPIVGFAKTVTFKAKDAVPLGEAGYMQKRLDYLDYVAGSPRPSIMASMWATARSGARCSRTCTRRSAASAWSPTARSATSR
jgi:hypothetical protein